LSEKVQQSKWEDAKHTSNDPALIGPPYLEIALLQKMPTGKKRTDPRQGTIDSDPEFMKFLESLTAPTQAKETDPEHIADDVGKADVKVTTTPLVEFLKEKKANKAKEAALAKSAKHARHESQNKGKDDGKKKGKEPKSDKAEKSTEKEKDKDKAKEPVKLLTKKAVAQEVAEAAKTAASQAASSAKASEEAAPKSRRANIAAAAKILQRDLGLSPGSAHRRARQDAAKADTTVKPESSKDTKDNERKAAASPTPPTGPSKSASTAPQSAPTAPKAQVSEPSRRGRNGKGANKSSPVETGKGKGGETLTTGKAVLMATPVILKRKDDSASAEPAPSASTTASTSTPTTPTGPKAAAGKAVSVGKPAPAAQKKGSTTSVTPGATRGFVKHANPSQGVTEPLLKQAMEAFGPVTFVEIDKRKGFAYVDFGNHDGLVKAVGASPVSVAQGTVQVLERKETKKVPSTPAPLAQLGPEKKPDPPTDRSKRGGRGRGRRGGANGATVDQAGPSTSQSGASVG
jgi:regulator of nonsense transcripts 3